MLLRNLSLALGFTATSAIGGVVAIQQSHLNKEVALHDNQANNKISENTYANGPESQIYEI